MDSFSSSFLSSTVHLLPRLFLPKKPHPNPETSIKSSVRRDPWSPLDGDPSKPKPRSKNPKHPLSDDDARRIIKKRAQYLSVLRRNQGPQAMTPKWIKRTPEQMVQYLEDDRNGHLYGKHVMAAIKVVRSMSQRKDCDMRMVMSSFVGKLSFREMCVVLKEQNGWRQARDFFAWMKLQLSYRPSVVVYTILLRLYGQVGKISLAEQTFLEMLEVGCEPDEVACGTMLCAYARWGRHKAMMTFYKAVEEREIELSTAVYNFMLSSLQKKSLHANVINLWRKMVDKEVSPNEFTYTVVVSSFVKEGLGEEANKIFDEMRNIGFLPEEVTYSLLISLSVKNDDQDRAISLFEGMRSRGIVPSNYTCASMLTLYYKTEDYPKALSLFADMEKNKIAADEVIRGLLIRIYGKLGLFKEAEFLFKETEKLSLLTDEKTYLAMSQVHLNSGDVEKALTIIEMMRSRNISLSRFAYIVLLRCYVRKGDLTSAEDAFWALSTTGLPDAGCCTDMLKMYLRLDSMEKARELIGWMNKNGVDISEELYKVVMQAYCKEGMVRDALQLTQKVCLDATFVDNKFIQTISRVINFGEDKPEKAMDVRQLEPMASGLALNLLLAEGNLDKIGKILKFLFETGRGLSLKRQIISFFLREGDMSKTQTIVDLIIKLGYCLDEEIVAAMIGYYGKQHKLQEAKQLFAAVREISTSRKTVINSMIGAYVRCCKPEEAYALYKESIDRELDLDAVTTSLVVNALTNNGKYQDAENVIHKIFESNLKLDTVAYNTMIKAMLEAGKLEFASAIYEQMLSSGISLSIQTYNTMISVYGQGQKLDKAVEMFNTACSSGLSIDEKTYTNIIGYYGKAGKRREASLLFTEMQRRGIKPGAVSYNIMIKVYATSGLCDEIERLLDTMQRDGCSLDSFTYLSLIQAYVKNSKFTEAEEILTSMEEKGMILSPGHFNLLLSAFAKAGRMVDAERIYNRLLASGTNPDLVCFRSMLRGYMSCGLTEDGLIFYEKIRETAQHDSFIMSAAVHLYKAAGKDHEAEATSSSMKSSGIPFLKSLKIGSPKAALNPAKTV